MVYIALFVILSATCLLTSMLRGASRWAQLPLLFYRRIESEGSLFRKTDGFNPKLTSGIDGDLIASFRAIFFS